MNSDPNGPLTTPQIKCRVELFSGGKNSGAEGFENAQLFKMFRALKAVKVSGQPTVNIKFYE